MGRGRLSQEEIQILRKNPYVLDAVETRIVYSNEFKHHFMKEYNAGKKPTQIFRDAGFDPKILGSKRIERCAHRWRESYAAGTLGIYQDAHINTREASDPLLYQGLYLIDRLEENTLLIQQQQEEINQLKEALRQLIEAS